MKLRNNTYLCMKLALIAMCSPLTVPSLAQTGSRNYVMSRTVLDDVGGSFVQSVQYLDGMGRPVQLADNSSTTSGKYVYFRTDYDASGRLSKVWQPAVGTTSPSYLSDASFKSKIEHTYDDGLKSYTWKNYDALGRLIAEYIPGEDWFSSDKCATSDYFTNTSGSVKRYRYGQSTCGYQQDGTCPPGSLSAVRLTDADGHSVERYSDALGNVVLERRKGAGTEVHDTYFIYDDMNRLRYVLPPTCQENGVDTSLYHYKYSYNSSGKCTEITLPGCEPTSYWYDRYNRLSFMQDGRMRNAGKCRFYLYDLHGRLAVQGMCDNDSLGSSLSSTKSAQVHYVSQVNVPLVFGTGYSLTDASYPLVSPKVDVVNYYDGYDFLLRGDFVSAASQYGLSAPSCQAVNVSSLPTGKVLSTTGGGKLYRVMYYDGKGRMTDFRATYPSGLYAHSMTEYTFTDKPSSSVTSYTYNGTPLPWGQTGHSYRYAHEEGSYSDQLQYEYVHYKEPSRRCRIWYRYNGLGQVSHKHLGGTVRNSYTYDVHGWVKGITSTNIDNSPYILFSESLHYADADGTPCYNGNVGSVDYVSADTTLAKRYRYTYDSFDRLTNAVYDVPGTSGMTGRYNLFAHYDKNGSLTDLLRSGRRTNGYGYIDALTYSYEGNRLSSVSDGISGAYTAYSGSFDFKDKSSQNVEYVYDGCGSLTQDSNKGVSLIDYDFDGNPTRVQFRNGDVTEYIYSSDGEKLRTIHRTSRTNLNVPYGQRHILTDAQTLSVDSTTYIGGLEIDKYFNGRYHFGDGYIDLCNSGGGSFHYFAKDHLGSVRTVVDSEGEVEQVNNYHPFGGLLNDVMSGAEVQRLKYNGKELDRMHGLDLYDYGARRYDPSIGLFTSIDPLCEKYCHLSPYAYCADNPVKWVDPNGMSFGDFYDFTGKYIGNDGIDDGKIYVMKTTKLGQIEDGVNYKGINKSKRILSLDFINANSGNAYAFENNHTIYDNFVEIISNPTIRSEMITVVYQDNGKGGSSPRNNREYGGVVRDGVVKPVEPSRVGNLKVDNSLEIDIPGIPGDIKFHSHPCGSISESHYSSSSIKTEVPYWRWRQHPSPTDIRTGEETINYYLFARGDRMIYIYNKYGVQTVFPEKCFLKF